MMAGDNRGRLTVLALGVLMVLGFQNCGDFALQEELLLEQGVLASGDSEIVPRLLDASDLVSWSKPGEPQFVNKSINADQWSVILAADRAATGDLITVNSMPGIEEAKVTISNGKIRAVRSNTLVTNYEEYLEVSLPQSGEKMVIAVSFGAKASAIKLMVNGILQTGSIVKSGIPADFSYLAKQVSSQALTGQVYEYMVYAGDSLYSQGGLSAQELNAMSRYLATNNSIPNVNLDPSLFIPGGGSSATPEFLAAKALLDSKCLSCHKAGGYSPDLSNLTETKAVDRGWVIKGNPNGSMLYYRLKNSQGGGGPKTMPTSGDLSAGEAQVVADWINSIQ